MILAVVGVFLAALLALAFVPHLVQAAHGMGGPRGVIICDHYGRNCRSCINEGNGTWKCV